jgi:hypothetical protein
MSTLGRAFIESLDREDIAALKARFSELEAEHQERDSYIRTRAAEPDCSKTKLAHTFGLSREALYKIIRKEHHDAADT